MISTRDVLILVDHCVGDVWSTHDLVACFAPLLVTYPISAFVGRLSNCREDNSLHLAGFEPGSSSLPLVPPRSPPSYQISTYVKYICNIFIELISLIIIKVLLPWNLWWKQVGIASTAWDNHWAGLVCLSLFQVDICIWIQSHLLNLLTKIYDSLLACMLKK